MFLSIALLGIAISVRVNKKNEPTPIAEPPAIGAVNSTHEHMTMLVFIRGTIVDFSEERYQLQSEYVHFENEDGITVHKHTTGVTLPYFIETLDGEISENCFRLARNSYCHNNNEKLRIFINRQELTARELRERELFHGDKILITFGNESSVDIGLRLNAVPDVREDNL